MACGPVRRAITVGGKEVHLVEDDNGGFLRKAKLIEDSLDFLHVLGGIGVDDIYDVEEKVGFG